MRKPPQTYSFQSVPRRPSRRRNSAAPVGRVAATPNVGRNALETVGQAGASRATMLHAERTSPAAPVATVRRPRPPRRAQWAPAHEATARPRIGVATMTKSGVLRVACRPRCTSGISTNEVPPRNRPRRPQGEDQEEPQQELEDEHLGVTERRRCPLDDPRLGELLPHHLEGEQDRVIVERFASEARTLSADQRASVARAGQAARPAGVVAEQPTRRARRAAHSATSEGPDEESGVEVRPQRRQNRQPPESDASARPGSRRSTATNSAKEEIGDQLRAAATQKPCIARAPRLRSAMDHPRPTPLSAEADRYNTPTGGRRGKPPGGE